MLFRLRYRVSSLCSLENTPSGIEVREFPDMSRTFNDWPRLVKSLRFSSAILLSANNRSHTLQQNILNPLRFTSIFSMNIPSWSDSRQNNSNTILESLFKLTAATRILMVECSQFNPPSTSSMWALSN